MAQRISEEESAKWSQVAAKLAQISALVSEARLIVLLELNVTEGKPLKAIDAIEEAASGMAYLFTPQTEWTGGDSSNAKNFKQTLPHIARQ